jgi:tetratricopeptide (TPR) repeat protein
MIDNMPLSKRENFDIRSRKIEIPLTGISNFEVTFELPIEVEIESIKKKYSIRSGIEEFREIDKSQLSELLRQKINELELQKDDFITSSKFNYHLHTLYALLEDDERSKYFLEEAKKMGIKDEYTRYKISKSLETGDTDTAKKLIKAPKSAQYTTLIEMAMWYLKEKELKGAVEYVRKAISRDSLRFESYILLGIVNIISGEVKDAIKVLRIATKLNEKSLVGHFLLGFCYTLLNSSEKSLHHLNIAYYIDPTDVNTVIALANEYIKLEQCEKAFEVLEEYVKFNPNIAEIWDRLSFCSYRMKKYERAIESLKYQITINENATSLNNIAVVYQKLGDIDRATRYFEYALSKFGEIENIVLLSNYLSLLVSKRLYTEALSYIEKVQSVQTGALSAPQCNALSNIYVNLMKSFYKTDRISEMAALGENVIESRVLEEIFLVNIRSYLLFVYSLNDEFHSKITIHIDALRKIIDQLKSSEKLYNRVNNNILYSLLESDRIDEAERIIDKLISRADKDPYLNATIGLYWLKKGAIDKGEAYYKRTIRMFTNQKLKDSARTKMNTEIARYYKNHNQLKQALHYIKNAIKSKNTYSEYRGQAKKLEEEISIMLRNQ